MMSQETVATPSPRRRNPLVILIGLSMAFFLIFLLLSGLLFFFQKKTGDSSAAPAAPLFRSGDSVGIIELAGIILDSKKFLKQLKQFEKNHAVKAVVVRLDSPGGAVAPSQEIYQALKNFGKPVVASMGTVAASGAYYIACGTKKIFANAGTLTGSIGVIMEFVNLRKLYEWAKINRYSITSGKFKGLGSDYRDMTDAERAILQGTINSVHQQFKGAVAAGRKLKSTVVDQIADGRIFSGEQALHHQLVDKIGTIHDATAFAGELAAIKGEPNVIYPDPERRKWLEYFLDNTAEEESKGLANDLRTLLRIFLALDRHQSGLSTPIAQSQVPTLMPGIYWLWTGH